MKKAAALVRTPQGLLILSVLAAIVSLKSVTAGVISALAVIFIIFRLRAAFILAAFYLLFQFFTYNSAFVLDIRYDTGGRTYITTKGYLNNINTEAHIGDLLWGKFHYDVVYSGYIPRLKIQPSDNYTAYKIFPLSNILVMRQTAAAAMFYRSGGVIQVAPAHIFAVRDYIPDRVNDEYIITGLAHLLAMSGFNVAIFTAGLFLLLFFIPRKLRTAPVFLLLPILIPMSGFAITVTRAVFFAMAAMAAWFFDFKVMSLPFLALVAGIILLFMPFSVISISFLLSFFAVFGIMVIFRRNYGFIKGTIVLGVASTIFTLPLQLYFFGTANVLSVLTTLIVTPVVWLQMGFGILAAVFPSVMIPPLAAIERFAAWFMDIISSVSWYTMYLAKPPEILLFAAFLAAFILCFTKLRLLSLFMLLLPLLPVYQKNLLIFPELAPSPKGYILVTDNGSEIFFQGMHSTFVYKMLPEAAKFGLKTFDYGRIRIFDSENMYIKVRHDNETMGLVCVNNIDGGCPYVYMTRSNSVKKAVPESVKALVVYNNAFADPKVILQSKEGTVKFNLGVEKNDENTGE